MHADDFLNQHSQYTVQNPMEQSVSLSLVLTLDVIDIIIMVLPKREGLNIKKKT